MPKDDINYKFTENGIVYDFYDVFVPAENFRQPSLWVWGFNAYSQLGINNAVDRSIPVTTFAGGTTWKQVAVGQGHVTAIKTDGTLWVWGSNFQSQLGLSADTATKNTPVTTVAGGNTWKSVANSLGNVNTVAIKTDGTLWVWGVSIRIGINNPTTTIRTPVTTFAGGTTWKQVSSAYYQTAAVKTDGSLWVWGDSNNVGLLGVNDNTIRNTPVTTFAGGNDWKQVFCERNHTVAIKTDGSLWVWGLGTNGRLGTNDTITRPTPVTTFAGGNTWKSVAAGYYHTAAIKTDGTLWVWGTGNNGQLGTNNTTTRSTPVTTFAGGNNWKSVDCGFLHTAAVKTDGSLWVWGGNGRGQLGNFSTAQTLTPITTFAGGNNWKYVTCGNQHTVAIKYSPDP
jgi:alpha-tubulin suppressor-like RCC1 family protein